ncbi:MAG: hypothetical protein IT249_06535 [Chitinophagaceae bacterium]|nr:hypothetical protein [Chitinophagaceae bacterium]
MNHIRYIQHEEIDKAKWDSCIENGEHGLIYGYSWWLDNISPGWHALVLNDYVAVMPLTWQSKYGISYLYQPFCTASLGVFYKAGINIVTEDFLHAIPARFKYRDIDMNEHNIIKNKSIHTYSRTNQLLNLTDVYKNIRERYSRLANRKLIKAKEHRLMIKKSVPPKTIIDLYKNEYQNRHKGSVDNYNALSRCCTISMEKGMAETYLAISPDDETLAFYIILKDKNFVYSLLGGSTAKGKDSGAFYFLTDAAIKDYCASGKTFRFEGSDNEGIAFFNSQFGAAPITYQHIRQNNLPFFLRVFKR